MRCFDCGKNDKLYEFTDGRRTIYLCSLCKAEREWREKSHSALIPLPPSKKKSFWQKLKDFFSFK